MKKNRTKQKLLVLAGRLKGNHNFTWTIVFSAIARFWAGVIHDLIDASYVTETLR